MQNKTTRGAVALAAVSLATAATIAGAQPPPGTPPRPSAFPMRQVDPAAVERGRALYMNNGCSFCHGADIRGGDGGPSLQRSGVVLSDEHGEHIGLIVKNGVKGTAMPAFQLTDAQIGDIADFLHSFSVSNGGIPAKRPPTILVGRADAGRQYFAKECAACHSATGDLAHIATKIPDPVNLQQGWIQPVGKPPVMATVKMADGSTISGPASKLDEFSITLDLPSGPRVIPRNGNRPAITIKDPMSGHRALIRRITDAQIHDVTAYLVTLK